MDAETVLGLITLAASVTTLIISSIIALRQVRLLRKSSDQAFMNDLIRELTTSDLLDREQRLWVRLPRIAPVALTRLPDEVRSDAQAIVALYQRLAYLVAFGIVVEDLVLTPTHYRIEKSWSVLRPFIAAEREARGGALTYANYFEGLANRSRMRQPELDMLFLRHQRDFGLSVE